MVASFANCAEERTDDLEESAQGWKHFLRTCGNDNLYTEVVYISVSMLPTSNLQ
jgi:hypothetical protein